MLEQVDLKKTISHDEFKRQIKPLKESLTALDGPIEPVMWRHWLTLPEAGQISVMDRSWYQETGTLRLEDSVDDLTNLRHMTEINSFERGLTDNGYLIIKFFLHITQKEEKARFEKLRASKDTAWRVTNDDLRRCREYGRYYNVFDETLEYTDTPWAPWHVVSGMNDEVRTLDVFRIVNDTVHAALRLHEEKKAAGQNTATGIIQPGPYHFVAAPKLADVDLSKSLDEAEKGAGTPFRTAQPDLPQKGSGRDRLRGLGRFRKRRKHQTCFRGA